MYQSALTLHHDIVETTRQFPHEFAYLRDQLRRVALSVVLNIAEGSAKKSDRDFNRYLKNSLGSTAEVVGGLDAAHHEHLITEETLERLLVRSREVSSQLGGFSKVLSVQDRSRVISS